MKEIDNTRFEADHLNRMLDHLVETGQAQTLSEALKTYQAMERKNENAASGEIIKFALPLLKSLPGIYADIPDNLLPLPAGRLTSQSCAEIGDKFIYVTCAVFNDSVLEREITIETSAERENRRTKIIILVPSEEQGQPTAVIEEVVETSLGYNEAPVRRWLNENQLFEMISQVAAARAAGAFKGGGSLYYH